MTAQNVDFDAVWRAISELRAENAKNGAASAGAAEIMRRVEAQLDKIDAKLDKDRLDGARLETRLATIERDLRDHEERQCRMADRTFEARNRWYIAVGGVIGGGLLFLFERLWHYLVSLKH